MKAHCYYEPIPGSGAEPIIELWRTSWERNGWSCVILGEQDFLRLPFSQALDFAARRLPTVNNWIYERACYRRWLAMAGIGGGLMTDYDVINVGFTPQDLPAYKGKMMRLNRQAPCVVYGRTINFLQAVDMFISYTPQSDDLFGDKMLVEDQTILNRYPHVADFHDLCSEWLPDHSNKETLVHFCNRVVTEAGTNKEKAIRDFLELKKT